MTVVEDLDSAFRNRLGFETTGRHQLHILF